MSYSHIIILMDGSGSMNEIIDDVIGGFNGFIENQKKEPGEAKISFIQFSAGINWYKQIFTEIPLIESPRLTRYNYEPSGGTALLDAIGKTINDYEERLIKNDPELWPSEVIFVIMTDGHENQSNKFNKEQIKNMIKHQKIRHGWNFIFLGADQDAFAEASGIGVAREDTFQFAKNSESVRCAYNDMNNMTSLYRRK